MVAVVTIAGKQYCVEPGQKLRVPHLTQAVGQTVSFDDALGGKAITVEILEHVLDSKIVIRKFRNKTRYQRTMGHRQPMTRVVVKETTSETKKPAAKKK